MRKSTKIVIITLVSITVFAVISVIMQFLVLPRFPVQSRTTLVWLGGTVLFSVTVLASLAQFTGYSIREIYVILSAQGSNPPPPDDTSLTEKRASWIDYIELFQIDEYLLAYIPIINDWTKGNPIRYFAWDALDITLDPAPFVLDKLFQTTPLDQADRNDPGCRLAECHIDSGDHSSISLKLQKTSYVDYLRSGEHLDDPFPDDARETFRSALAGIVVTHSGKVKPEKLTNICGTGIFLVTKDDKIIVAKHPKHSRVYPRRLSFSASGLMKWGAYPSPFMEMARKTFQEIQFQVRPGKTQLIGFGADARKLYFQFSFMEYVDQTSTEIVENYKEILDHTNQGLLRDRPPELITLPFDLTEIRDSVMNCCWEPAAEASLLTLCADRFGPDRTAKALFGRQGDWTKRERRDEWDYRASQKGHLPDMSIRYPPEKLEEELGRHLTALFDFMGDDLSRKDVVEIGCGSGSITERLVDVAIRVTCLDLCEAMIENNQDRLGSKAEKVSYILQFGEDYRPPKPHDVAICSRVLIHNVSASDFRELVKSICDCAKTAFVFEDVTQGRPTSEATKLRTRGELQTAFADHGLHLERSGTDYLFDDEIALLKFIR